jgi:hypothetical protein
MREAAFALALFAGGPALAAPTPAADSEEQLVLDVKAMLDDELLRPSHVEPALAGSFAELSAPHWAAVRDAGLDAVTFDESIFHAVGSGEQPVGDLPPALVRAATAAESAVRGVLAATHATSGRLPPELAPFAVYSRDVKREMAPHYAVLLANVLALRALADHRPDAALEICGDQLALARDVSRGGLFGALSAAGLHALAAAGPTDRERFRRALARICEGWPTLAAILTVERIEFDVSAFWPSLSKATKRALPPEAQLDRLRGLADEPGPSFEASGPRCSAAGRDGDSARPWTRSSRRSRSRRGRRTSRSSASNPTYRSRSRSPAST